MDFMALVAVVLFLTEGTVEGIKSILSEKTKAKVPWPLVAGIAAFGLAWAFNLRILEAIGMPVSVVWVEYAVVGIAGSRGSGWLHDLISLTQKKKAEAPAVPTLLA